MSFRDCINSAIDQKAITKDEGDDLLRRFDDMVKPKGVVSPDFVADFETQMAAKNALSRTMRYEMESLLDVRKLEMEDYYLNKVPGLSWLLARTGPTPLRSASSPRDPQPISDVRTVTCGS